MSRKPSAERYIPQTTYCKPDTTHRAHTAHRIPRTDTEYGTKNTGHTKTMVYQNGRPHTTHHAQNTAYDIPHPYP
eukprot:6622029-Karenia_brevis.AAC.1